MQQRHLQSDCVLMLPLHVIDVPGHARHGVDGLLHHLVARRHLWVKVLGDLLQHNAAGCQPRVPSLVGVVLGVACLPGAAGGT